MTPAAAPRGRSSATKNASPSDTSRSGSNEARANRAASMGIVPIPEAKISPSPRHASAQATTQMSARAGVVPVIARSLFGHRVLVVALALQLEVLAGKSGPFFRVDRGGRVRALEGLIPIVVGDARREVCTS